MSTLTSASTDDQVWVSYDDNASFEEDSSYSKAVAFVTACRILSRRRPTSFSQDGTAVAFNDAAIQADMKRAQQYAAANRSGAGNRYVDLSCARD